MVLVVDDNRVNLDLACAVLERNGAKTCNYEDAEAALDAVPAMQPDAVLLDMHLPGMDGWEAARQLRSRLTKQVPVIVISTAENDCGERALKDAGIVAWLPKPLHEAILVSTLLRWTGRESKMEIPMDTSRSPPEDLKAALTALKPEILQMLEEDLPLEQHEAERAFAGRDWANLQSHIHRLHGTASFCHLEALRVLCAGIEHDLKEQQPPITEVMHKLDGEVRRILAALGGSLTNSS